MPRDDNMNTNIHCPMCGGTPPAHFEDCKSIERKKQEIREREIQRAADAAAEALENEPVEFPVLFVGGRHDGYRIPVKDLEPIKTMPYPNPDYDTAHRKENAYEPREPAYLYETYRREAFKSPAGLYPVYVFDKVPQEDVIHMLLDGYKTAV